MLDLHGRITATEGSMDKNKIGFTRHLEDLIEKSGSAGEALEKTVKSIGKCRTELVNVEQKVSREENEILQMTDCLCKFIERNYEKFQDHRSGICNLLKKAYQRRSEIFKE